MRLIAFTIHASYLAPIPVIHIGGVVRNRIIDVARMDVVRAYGDTFAEPVFLPDGSIRVEVCRAR